MTSLKFKIVAPAARVYTFLRFTLCTLQLGLEFSTTELFTQADRQ